MFCGHGNKIFSLSFWVCWILWVHAVQGASTGSAGYTTDFHGALVTTSCTVREVKNKQLMDSKKFYWSAAALQVSSRSSGQNPPLGAFPSCSSKEISFK